MKRTKRKSRRVRLAEAIRRDCDPVLFAMGYRNPAKTDLDRWRTTRRNSYFRWRGTDYDEIIMYWDKYNRPKVRIEVKISRVETPPQGDRFCVRWISYATIKTWRGINKWVNGCWFGPWRSPEKAAAFVNRRLLQLEAYLLRGEAHWAINFGPARRVTFNDELDRLYPRQKVWGDPWLDPESVYLKSPAAQG